MGGNEENQQETKIMSFKDLDENHVSDEDIMKMTSDELQELSRLSVGGYRAWRDFQPDSPTPIGVRLMVRGYYDLQKLRIALGNKCFAQLRSKLGLAPSDKEVTDKEAAKVLDKIRAHYKKVTKGVKGALTARKFKADGVFSDYSEFCLVRMFMEVQAQEETAEKSLKSVLVGIPVYDDFLSRVDGIGDALAAFLLAELNPLRARHASSFWKYLGLDLGCDGTGRGRFSAHMEKYWTLKRAPDGTEHMEKTRRLTHAPHKKAKVVEVLTTSMVKKGVRWFPAASAEHYESMPGAFRRIQEVKDIKGADPESKDQKILANAVEEVVEFERVIEKTGTKVYQVKMVAEVVSKYVEAYMAYKHRKAHDTALCKVRRKGPKDADGNDTTVMKEIRWCDTTKAHRERAGRRFMAKMFVAEFWAAWRTSLGLPVSKPYAEEFLGRAPHGEGGRVTGGNDTESAA